MGLTDFFRHPKKIFTEPKDLLVSVLGKELYRPIGQTLSLISDPKKMVEKSVEESLRPLGQALGYESGGGDTSAEPVLPFALPTNFPLAAARGRLSGSLAKQRKRSETNITGGLGAASVAKPSLFTI